MGKPVIPKKKLSKKRSRRPQAAQEEVTMHTPPPKVEKSQMPAKTKKGETFSEMMGRLMLEVKAEVAEGFEEHLKGRLRREFTESIREVVDEAFNAEKKAIKAMVRVAIAKHGQKIVDEIVKKRLAEISVNLDDY